MNAAPDQKKKGGRILTAILLLLTVITVVAAILIHRTVRGDALLYLNSRLGHLCAVSHRWVTLAACLMVVATALWLLYRRRVTVRRKQAITTEGASGSQAEISETSGEPALEPTISQPVAASVPDEESLSAIKYTVAESLSGERCCPACGLWLSASAHFCTACGTALPDEAEPAAEKGGSESADTN